MYVISRLIFEQQKRPTSVNKIPATDDDYRQLTANVFFLISPAAAARVRLVFFTRPPEPGGVWLMTSLTLRLFHSFLVYTFVPVVFSKRSSFFTILTSSFHAARENSRTIYFLKMSGTFLDPALFYILHTQIKINIKLFFNKYTAISHLPCKKVQYVSVLCMHCIYYKTNQRTVVFS